MRPSYSNIFSITGNKANNEVVLQFKQQYPESKEVKAGVIETDTLIEPVASVVITEKMAAQLINALSQVISNN